MFLETSVIDSAFRENISFILSLSAFAISNVGAFLAYFAGRREKRRAMRNMITEILGKMYANRGEFTKFQIETAGRAQTKEEGAYAMIISQEFYTLLNQAMYVAEQAPELVTSIEYNTLGWANMQSSEYVTAEKFYKLSVERANDDFVRSQAIRSYGDYLYNCNLIENARDQYREALSIYPADTDQERRVRITTYTLWIASEIQFVDDQSFAMQKYSQALDEIKRITNSKVRKQTEDYFKTQIFVPENAKAEEDSNAGADTNPVEQ